ncbi:MAG: hypothetical protein OXG15_04260, partial [Gammaproteobacteria bacterium]|nr:hypothetical protein [Gammaproteobacteria bacterium]
MTELAARINSQMAALHGAGSIAGGGAGSVGAFTAGSIVGGLAGRLGGGGGTGGATFVPPVPSSGPPSTPDNIAGGNVVPIRSSGQSSRSGVMGGVGRVAAGALGLAGLGFLGGPVAAAGLMGFGSTIFTDYNRNKSPRSAPIDYPRYLVRWRGNIGRGIERRDSYDNMVSSGFANHGYGTEFLGPSEAESPFLAGHTRLYRSGGVGEIEARMGEHRLFWTPSTAVARIYGTMSGNEFIDDKILRYTDVPNSAFDRTLITNFLAWNENFEYHPLSEQYRSWEHFVRDHIGGTPTAFLAEGEEIMPWDYDRRYGMMAGTEYDPLPMSVWLSGLPGGYGQERNIEGRRRYAKAILAARSRNRRIIDVTSDERGGWNPGAIAYGVRSAPGRAYNWLFGEEPASFTIDDAGRVRGPRGRFVSGARLEASGYERVGNEYRHPDRMGFFGATRFGRGLRAVDNAAFFGGFGKIAGSLHASREMRTSASHFLDWFEDDPFNRAQAFHRHHGTMSSSLTGRHRRRYNRRLRGILDGLDPLDRTFLGLDSGDLGLEDAEPARSWFDRQFGDDDDDLERKGSLYSAISMRSKMIGTSLLGTATFIPGGLRNVALGLGFSTLFGGGIGLMGVGAGLAIGGSALTFRRFARGRTTPEGAQIPGDIRGTEVLDDLVAQFHSLVDTIATAVGPGLMQLAEMISSAMSTIGGAIDWLQQYQGIGRDVVGDQAAGILQTAAPFVGAGVGALAGVKLGATLGGTIGAGAGPIGALIGLGAGGLAGLAGGAMAGGFLFGQDDEAPTGIGRFIQGYNPTIMENYLSDEFVSLLQAEPKLLEDLSLVPFGERRTSRSSGLPMRYGGTGDLVSRLVALNAGEPYSATEMSFLTNQAYMYKRSQELAGTPMGMARDVPTLPYESRSLSGMDRLLGQLRGEYPQYADRINVGLLQDRGIDIGRYGYNIP